MRSTDTPSDRSTDETETQRDFDDWEPIWQHSVEGESVLGLDADGHELFASTNSTAVFALDWGAREQRWRTELEGDHVGKSRRLAHQTEDHRDKSGVTIGTNAVFSVTELEALGPYRVHRLDRETGEETWSFEREPKLTVEAVLDDTVFISGEELFVPENEHETPDEPLTTVLYAIDATTGDERWSVSFDAVGDIALGTELVYVGAGDQLHAIGFNGELEWEHETTHPIREVHTTDDRTQIYLLTDVEYSVSVVHGFGQSGTHQWAQEGPFRTGITGPESLYVGGNAVAEFEPDGSCAWQEDRPGSSLLLGPDFEMLYTRGQDWADATDIYSLVDGTHEFTVDPLSSNAFPIAATATAVITEAMTSDPRTTIYAVDLESGDTMGTWGSEFVFTAAVIDGTVFLGDGPSTVHAFPTEDTD